MKRLGWVFMGYPMDLPGWRRIYRFGARMHDASSRYRCVRCGHESGLLGRLWHTWVTWCDAPLSEERS